MTISVFKFGGSCLKDAEAFSKIERIVNLHSSEKKIFVVSALAGITDTIAKIADIVSNHEKRDKILNEIAERHYTIIEEVFNDFIEEKKESKEFIQTKLEDIRNVCLEIEEFGPKTYFMDYLLSFGEKMSTKILHLFLRSRKLHSKYIIGEDIIITDSNFGNCLPIWNYTKLRIEKKIGKFIENPDEDTIFCVTGFIGRNRIGYTTTLGRGGSDFSATIIARSLYDTELPLDKDIRVVLWKDVDGILATNPKYVNNPKLIKNLNYDEAKEMAFYGAKILHPMCLFGLDERHIPVEIRNFNNPDSKQYSTIGDITGEDEITGISTIEDVIMLSVASASLVSTPGVLAKIFSIMGNNDINVSLVAQSSSEINTTFIVEEKDGKKAFELINSDEFFKGWAEVEIESVSILAVTGKGISSSGVQARIMEALSKDNIKIKALSQSSEGLNLSMVIDKDKIGKAVSLIDECIKCV